MLRSDPRQPSIGRSSERELRLVTKAGKVLRKMQILPKIIAFDLDGTLWWPEMYMLSRGAPFRRDSSGAVYDASGERIRLMGDTESIMRELVTDPMWKDTTVAYVSRTEHPEWAVPCLKTFIISDGVSMYDIGKWQEIYPGGKRTHFKRIHQKSGVAYKDMLFFDNERWNITDVSTLGVTSIYTPKGMTAAVWREGLAAFSATAATR